MSTIRDSCFRALHCFVHGLKITNQDHEKNKFVLYHMAALICSKMMERDYFDRSQEDKKEAHVLLLNKMDDLVDVILLIVIVEMGDLLMGGRYTEKRITMKDRYELGEVKRYCNFIVLWLKKNIELKHLNLEGECPMYEMKKSILSQQLAVLKRYLRKMGEEGKKKDQERSRYFEDMVELDLKRREKVKAEMDRHYKEEVTIFDPKMSKWQLVGLWSEEKQVSEEFMRREFVLFSHCIPIS